MNQEMEQELIERYIYQVVKRLPKEQREEVKLELRELIDAMSEQGKTTEEVLMELGDPSDFASKYRDDSHYLIGPEYYDTYLWIVRIVMLCTLIPVLITSIIDGFCSEEFVAQTDYIGMAISAFSSILANVISSCLVSVVGSFGGVTLIFAIMERQKVKLERKKEKKWTLEDLGVSKTGKHTWTPSFLSPIPDKKAFIGRSDSIVSIIFTVLFCILLIFAPQLFCIIFKENGIYSNIHILNLEKWNVILPFLLASMLIGLTDDILRLVMGVYCRFVMISSIVCGVLQIILSFIVLKVFPLWNPNITELVLEHMGDNIPRPITVFDGNTVSSVILAFVVVATLIEMGTTIYKTIRYGADTK